DIDPDLLKHPAAHDRHLAAAAFAGFGIGPGPSLPLEPPRRQFRAGAGQFIFQPFKCLAGAVAQGTEPTGCIFAVIWWIGAHDAARLIDGLPAVTCSWRIASPATIAAAMATLRLRRPGRIGMTRRASAAAATSGGTPPLSRPTSRVSSGAKAKSV